MSQPHRENGTLSLLGASNPALDDDSRGDQGKLCSHRILAVPAAQMKRREVLRLLQAFPAPAHPAVPMGESVLSLSFTFLSIYVDFFLLDQSTWEGF